MRTRCGRHRCAPASDRERPDPRQDRCAAWSGLERPLEAIATTPPQWPPNARFSLDWSPYSQFTRLPAARRSPSRAWSRECAGGYTRPSGFTAPSCGLRHAPEEGQRPLLHTGDVLAPRRVAQEEAGRRIDDVVERRLVETFDRGLLLIEVLGFEPCRDFLFHRFACGPAPPRLVAVGANAIVSSGVDAVRAGVPGVEHLPAPLARRPLLGAAGANRAPIGRDEVDIHAQMLEQIRGDIALRFGDRLILRHHARDRLVRITALGQELLGRSDIALALQNLATLFRIERRIRREETRQRLPERGIIPDQRTHVVFLAESCEHGTSR